ncbi:MAG: hypothetical protein ABFC24_04465 [Methanoregulaceae archaeon]
MVPIFEPGNLRMLLFLIVQLGIPLTILAGILFLGIRKIPSLAGQVLTPLAAGIVVTVISSAMEPPGPQTPALARFLLGMFIYPLLLLPPVLVLKEYLHRIPATVAALAVAFVSISLVLLLGAVQGDLRQDELGSVAWRSLVTVAKALVLSAAVSGLVLGLDRLLAGRGRDPGQERQG